MPLRLSSPVRAGAFRRACVLVALSMVVATVAAAGPLRDRLLQRRAETASRSTAPELPPGVRVLRDVAYGSDAKQKLDVYRSDRPLERAPIVLMVHGGAWRMGDKAASAVVENKVSRWAPRGIVLVSIDYRLLPTPVEDQLADVLQALVFVQRHAAEWGGDAGKIVLMGHSAGAHLIDLLDASPAKARQAGALPWLGAVSLDSAVLDVPALMRERHLALYDEALGNDPARWRALSPLDQLVAGAPPLLAVCSSKRRDRPCDPTQRFAARAAALGNRVEVLPQALSHEQINERLGTPGAYTTAVETFMASLDPTLARAFR